MFKQIGLLFQVSFSRQMIVVLNDGFQENERSNVLFNVQYVTGFVCQPFHILVVVILFQPLQWCA